MKLRYILLPVLLLMGQTPAHAADENILAVTPLNNVKAGYFEATLEPGETTDFTLRIATNSDSHLTSRVAGAVPRTNGGFSLDDALTPSASWFSYEPQSFDLRGVREETFTLTVPEDTTAGEYASGIVVETDYLDTDSTGIKNRTQQIVPVNIVVEGEAQPDFTLGSASHKFKSGKSLVLFEVTNTGNKHVSPAGPAEVHDSSGKTVSTADLEMSSFYTGTTGTAEIVLGDALLPGDYTVTPVLKDAKSEASATAEIPFTVEGHPETGDEKNLPQVIQEQGNWILPVIAVLLVLVLAALAVLLVRRRKS